MRVLLLPDADFLTRERALIQRLQVGLADEGVRVVEAIPATAEAGEAAAVVAGGLYATPVTYFDKGLPLTGSLRARELVRKLDELAKTENHLGRPVDVVHVLGEAAWPMGLWLSRRTAAPALLEVWSRTLLAKARHVWRTATRPGQGSLTAAARPRFLAPDEPMAAELARLVPAERVIVTPWGVHGSDRPRGPIDPSRGVSVAVLASGRDSAAVLAGLRALAIVARRIPGLMILVDGAVSDRVPVWKWTGGKLGEPGDMRSRISMVSDLEGRHDLLSQADMLLIPEALGEYRSIVLQGMAEGMVVVARADPLVGWLVPGETAHVLNDSTPDTIAEAVLSLLENPERAAALRASAMAYVRLHRPGSAHVRALLALCEAVAPAVKIA